MRFSLQAASPETFGYTLVYGGEWSTWRFGCFILRKRVLGIHWLSLRTGFDEVVKRKALYLQKTEHQLFNFVLLFYWARRCYERKKKNKFGAPQMFQKSKVLTFKISWYNIWSKAKPFVTHGGWQCGSWKFYSWTSTARFHVFIIAAGGHSWTDGVKHRTFWTLNENCELCANEGECNDK
jgi:hypothetical protein